MTLWTTWSSTAILLVSQLPNDAEDQKESVLKDAIDPLKTATDLDPSMAGAWALLSGCYGQRMGLDPMRGMTLGPKANDAMNKAKDLVHDQGILWACKGRVIQREPVGDRSALSGARKYFQSESLRIWRFRRI